MPTLPKKVGSRWTGSDFVLSLLPLSAATLLSGCAANVDRMRTSSIAMDDYRNRHPIVLAEAAQNLDIFPPPELRGLDRRTYAQVAEYGRRYHYNGQGQIEIFIPTGANGGTSPSMIQSIRRALAAGGPMPLCKSRPIRSSTEASPPPCVLASMASRRKLPIRVANGARTSRPAVACKAGITSLIGTTAAPIRI